MEFHNPGYFLKPGMYRHGRSCRPSWRLRPCWCRTWRCCAAARKTPSLWRWTVANLSRAPSFWDRERKKILYQVLSGLKEGERVVTSGQFMLDSESQLREAIQKMMKPAEGRPSLASPNQRAADVTQRELQRCRNMSFTSARCLNMSRIQYDHPGKCSICGMTLVPVTPEHVGQNATWRHICNITPAQCPSTARSVRTNPANAQSVA